MEVKSETLERELGFFRGKEQKLKQYPGKYIPGMKNQVQATRKQKNLDNSAEATEEEVRPVTTLGNEETTPAPYVSSAKNMQKRSYTLIVVFKLA